jgi:CRP/FNR family transcriptional regulator, cyclic AMP receptor protein
VDKIHYLVCGNDVEEDSVTNDIFMLKQIPFLQSLSESELRGLIPLLKPVDKKPGDILFHEGEIGNSVYFVGQGRVKFTFRHFTGEFDTFEEIGPGQFFGEVGVFTAMRERTATAEVIQPLQAYELSRDDLLHFLQEHTDATLHLVAGMAERLRRSGYQLEFTPARNLNVVAHEQLTTRDRLARWVAQFAGSPLFLISHALAYSLWVVINTRHSGQPIDPFPFHLLALVIGAEALIFSCFVLMNQYREDKAQASRNDHEYSVNLNAEKAVAHLHERLDKLQRELIKNIRKEEPSKVGRAQ